MGKWGKAIKREKKKKKKRTERELFSKALSGHVHYSLGSPKSMAKKAKTKRKNQSERAFQGQC